MQTVIGKMVLSILAQLLTQEVLIDLFIWAAKTLATHTSTPIDDELVAIIENKLGKKKEEAVG